MNIVIVNSLPENQECYVYFSDLYDQTNEEYQNLLAV